MTKKRIGITDGGIALPLGNNTFLMRGRLHSQGGIGIGNGGKNDIEVEDGEVVRFNKNNIQVLSDQPMLNGVSPANALLAGGDFNKIFKAQQSINGNHHGSYGKDGLIKKLVGLLTGGNNKKENTDKAEPLNLEELKLRQAYAESGFDSNARSNKDAIGLFQIRENLLTDYNNAHGTNYTLEDLYDDKLNMSVRDWKMDKNLASDWAIRNNAPDSVVYAKSLGGYNMGNQNFLNYLGKAKAAGVDIYNSMDWISEKWLPKETVDYINFILRNQNNSPSRNNAAYELNKKKNSDKVEGIRKGFDTGGVAFKTDTIVDPITKDTTFIQKNGEDSYSVWQSPYNMYGYSEDEFSKKEDLDYTSNDYNIWFKDWLNARKDILKKNADNTTYGYVISQAPNAKDFYDFSNHSVLLKPRVNIPIPFFRNNDDRINNIIDAQTGNVEKTIQYMPSEKNKNKYFGDRTSAAYYQPSLKDYNGNFIVYNQDYITDGIIAHEKGHSARAIQQQRYIRDIIFKDRNINASDHFNKHYPTKDQKVKEIFAGMQDYRYNHQLDPSKEVTREYIKNVMMPEIKRSDIYYMFEKLSEDELYRLFNEVAKNETNTANENNVFYAKNGGQINMKLKYKNKQDITDIVMNEILPPSTGERKKFVLGGSEWSLIGNLGLNLLNGVTQGIIGSINSSRLTKMYKGLKRQSTYIPTPREHINTKVDVEPQLNLTAETEYNLRRNAMMNTANAKVSRSQARIAALDRIKQDNIIYSDKFNKETALRNAEAELQTRYNIADTQNKIGDIREQNEFDLNKTIGIANAKTSAAQTWGQGIASTLLNAGKSLTDYSEMNNDLLKSNSGLAHDKWFANEFGMYKNKVNDAEWIKNNKDWYDTYKNTMIRLGWINS